MPRSSSSCTERDVVWSTRLSSHAALPLPRRTLWRRSSALPTLDGVLREPSVVVTFPDERFSPDPRTRPRGTAAGGFGYPEEGS